MPSPRATPLETFPAPAEPGRIRVVAADIDHMGHVNNSVYLRWVESAVHGHWAKLTTPAEQAAYLWIAVRHELDYLRPAFLHETLTIEVTITSVRRARAWYDTVVSRDGLALARATSCWCCLDGDTRRLTVIPPELTARFFADRDGAG